MFFEIVLLASNMVLWTNHSSKSFQMLSSWKFAALSIDMTRILLLLGMTGLYAVFVIFAEYPEQNGEGENSGLLPPSRASTGYGSIAETTKGTQEEQGPAWARRNLVGVRQSWWEYLHGYTVGKSASSKKWLLWRLTLYRYSSRTCGLLNPGGCRLSWWYASS